VFQPSCLNSYTLAYETRSMITKTNP